MPSAEGQYRAKSFVMHCSKLRLHQRNGDRGPHADPGRLLQFTPEEHTETREHADSWIEGADLEHVKVSAKTIPPPPQEPSRAGPMRTRRGGRGGGGGGGGGGGRGSRAPPSPLKTLAGGALDQPPSPQSGQTLDRRVLEALTQGPPPHQGAASPEEERVNQTHLHTGGEKSTWRKPSQKSRGWTHCPEPGPTSIMEKTGPTSSRIPP